jgi:hypothetical protein
MLKMKKVLDEITESEEDEILNLNMQELIEESDIEFE